MLPRAWGEEGLQATVYLGLAVDFQYRLRIWTTLLLL